MNAPRGSILLAVWVAVVVLSVGTGLYLVGSPADERARRMDARRLIDLQAIAEAADLYWTRHDSLPISITELAAEPGVNLHTVDPVNAEAYGYLPLDSIHYEVCAIFERESGETSSAMATNLWVHGAGRQCFTIEAKEVT